MFGPPASCLPPFRVTDPSGLQIVKRKPLDAIGFGGVPHEPLRSTVGRFRSVCGRLCCEYELVCVPKEWSKLHPILGRECLIGESFEKARTLTELTDLCQQNLWAVFVPVVFFVVIHSHHLYMQYKVCLYKCPIC
jgi:hypothetical protein